MTMAKDTNPLAERGRRKKARLAILEANKPRGLIVEPADDDMRRVLKHPINGRFRKSGSANWPDDRYTRKRLRDGSLKLVENKKQQHQTSSQSSTSQS
jgi:hypothetical protein